MLRHSLKGLSVAAAPYQVILASGKEMFFTTLGNICSNLNAAAIRSVYDRHAKSFLDIQTIFKSKRRKFIQCKKKT
jgi:hypothetical protein